MQHPTPHVKPSQYVVPVMKSLLTFSTEIEFRRVPSIVSILRLRFHRLAQEWEEFSVACQHCDLLHIQFISTLLLLHFSLMRCLYTHATVVSSTWCTGAPLSINYNNNSPRLKRNMCFAFSLVSSLFSEAGIRFEEIFVLGTGIGERERVNSFYFSLLS